MLFPESQLRIWLCTRPTDMRKSYDGLAAEVRQRLGEDPLSGELFVFINRRATQLKILYFDRSGYCVWSKRLERGRFHGGREASGKRRLSWTELKLILEGIDQGQVHRYRRYRRSQPEGVALP